MSTRYLYGKKEYLSELLSRKLFPRFSDISHYSRLENNCMRDDEERKEFFMNRNEVVFSINGITIPKEDLAADFKFTLPVRHCYCLCLSKKKNDKELFKKFKADICLEIDVERLVAELRSALHESFAGTEVIVRDVVYYNAYECIIDVTHKERVFYKPVKFKHEEETRIALFYPEHKSGFQAEGKVIPFRAENESRHITIKIVAPDINLEYVKNVFYREQLPKL
ncbi:MAG: hypothetical protein ACRC8G_16875 [Plesiomonas shigelloides]